MKRLLPLMSVCLLSVVAITAWGSSRRHPTVLYVGHWPSVHYAYRTIQAAVNVARPGDRVLIAAGDYHESPSSGVGVRVRTRDITVEGVDRNTVIVDGTKPGAASPCDPDPRFQNFGPVIHRPNGVLINGRNGIEVRASGVTVENLTVCNFVGTASANEFGNQVWFNGGAATGKTGLASYHVANVTTTSTYIPVAASPSQGTPPVPMAADAGVLISNVTGPGTVIHSFASNMADSGFHIAACPDCKAAFDHDTAKHNVIGFSATDAGGRLLLKHSVFEHNGAGVNLASENNEDAPPPQDGACPPGVRGPEPFAPERCTVIEHNTVQANNNSDVSPEAAEVFLGAGIDIAGGRHDLVFANYVSNQGSYGIVTTVFVSTGSGGFPNADCQQGRALPGNTCFFNASDNLIADNELRNDGFFENPTNGDLEDAALPATAPDCFRGNADRSGRLTVAPHGLPVGQDCAAHRGDTLFGVLGVQLLCAVGAFGDCHGGNGNAVLRPLAALSHLLQVPFDAAAVRDTRAIYPAPGRYVTPWPGRQPSLHPKESR